MSKIRLALYPLGILYDGITRIKNSLYSKGIIKSKTFPIPLIVIGNLSVGGTGKTPHTEYIAKLFDTHKKTAVLSRGYGRKTKGYILANSKSTAKQIGDEPLQISQNLPLVNVAVCEDRTTGVKKLIAHESAELIILDDAFQHRKILGSYYILITTYQQPYFSDFVLPTGNLRESKSNSSRANIIVISKCPEDLSLTDKNTFISKVQPLSHQSVFFSYIKYASAKKFHGNANWETSNNVLLVTGIVNPTPLRQHLESTGKVVTSFTYSDHYEYTQNDILKITEFLTHQKNNFVVATTSKDKVKLQELISHEDSSFSFFEIPITVGFLFNEEEEFKSIIKKHVSTF
ncbi:MAG: tetraacyldisaccharide 4'-kinase [Salibacteraceae bacterium]